MQCVPLTEFAFLIREYRILLHGLLIGSRTFPVGECIQKLVQHFLILFVPFSIFRCCKFYLLKLPFDKRIEHHIIHQLFLVHVTKVRNMIKLHLLIVHIANNLHGLVTSIACIGSWESHTEIYNCF